MTTADEGAKQSPQGLGLDGLGDEGVGRDGAQVRTAVAAHQHAWDRRHARIVAQAAHHFVTAEIRHRQVAKDQIRHALKGQAEAGSAIGRNNGAAAGAFDDGGQQRSEIRIVVDYEDGLSSIGHEGIIGVRAAALEWGRTVQWLLYVWARKLAFTLDPCTTRENVKCLRLFVLTVVL